MLLAQLVVKSARPIKLCGAHKIECLLAESAIVGMSLKTTEIVYSVEFSPFQHSSNLLAIGGRTGITIKACTLKVSLLVGYRYGEAKLRVHL